MTKMLWAKSLSRSRSRPKKGAATQHGGTYMQYLSMYCFIIRYAVQYL